MFKFQNLEAISIFRKLSELDIHPIITTEVYRRVELLNALNFIDEMKNKFRV